MKRQIEVIIADDHEVYRDGLRLLLAKADTISIVEEAANGRELVSLCAQRVPDVILTDIMMPVMDGIEATLIISQQFPAAKVIALSMSNQDNLIVDMLYAGAMGYLVKNANKTEIVDAIHTVFLNKPYYCKSTSLKLARVLARVKPGTRWNNRIFFSQKELEIIRLICEDKTNREIAQQMFLSVRTVEEYRLRIKDKMDVKGTPGIVIYAIRNALFRVPDES
jgi:DNA-binding NarL/FixJ family response regulator